MWLNVDGPDLLMLRLDGTRPDRSAVSIARCEIAVLSLPPDTFSNKPATCLEQYEFRPHFAAWGTVLWKDKSGSLFTLEQLTDFAFTRFHLHLEQWFRGRRQ